MMSGWVSIRSIIVPDATLGGIVGAWPSILTDARLRT